MLYQIITEGIPLKTIDDPAICENAKFELDAPLIHPDPVLKLFKGQWYLITEGNKPRLLSGCWKTRGHG